MSEKKNGHLSDIWDDTDMKFTATNTTDSKKQI